MLVDYRKFTNFIDNTALVRGRSFAALVGLSRYATLRRALEGAKHTQSLNSDFEIKVIESEIKSGERQLAEYTRQALAAYTEVTSQTQVDLADIPALAAAVTTALRDIELLRPILGTAGIMAADLGAADRAVESAEGEPLRQEHAALLSKIAAHRTWRVSITRTLNMPTY